MPCACGTVVWSLLNRGHSSLHDTAYSTPLFESFVLVNQSLSEVVLGFEVHWNVMFREDPSKFL